MDYSYKIFCVNLKRDIKRKNKMSKQFKKFGKDAIFIEAFDSKNIDDKLLQKIGYYETKNKLTKSEIGCAMSHLKIYENIVKNNIPLALICEDDIKFNINYKTLDKYLPHIPEDIDICYLYYNNPYKKVNKYIGLFDGYFTYACCYLITLKSCETILKYAYPIRLQSDELLANLEVTNKINVCLLIPKMVKNNGYFDSNIRKNGYVSIFKIIISNIIIKLCQIGVFHHLTPNFILNKRKKKFDLYKSQAKKNIL